MAEDNALLAIIKSARIKGKDFVEIEQLFGIPAPKAEAILKAHYAEKTVDPVEYRMLQLDRLESLIDVLMSMAHMGNIKSAEVLIKTLEQINVLLGLNLEQTKIEIRVVTDQQMQVVYQVITDIKRDLLKLVQENVKDQKALSAVEEKWDATLDNSFAESSERVIEAELVQ